MKLGPVIRRLRHAKGWTLQKMCNEMDYVVQPGHLSRIERDEQTPSAYIINHVAKALGASVDAMFAEAGGGPLTPVVKDPARYIPIVSWVQAGSWTEATEAVDPEACDDWVIAPKRVPRNCFALRVKGDSMQSPYGMSFPEGCIIIVSANQHIDNKSYVVARQNGDEATFKQVVMEGGNTYLKPLNPQYPIMQINEETVICGVVVAMVCELTGAANVKR